MRKVNWAALVVVTAAGAARAEEVTMAGLVKEATGVVEKMDVREGGSVMAQIVGFSGAGGGFGGGEEDGRGAGV